MSLLSIIFAILGLGFLVFIHELGHYWVARRKGMKVEAFSIGFGKPLYSWERDGVKWQIGMLPFGGYVKIAGMQKEGNKEPYEIPDGFFAKPPLQRIQVALAGPVVNIVFAFLAFALLWALGGREKNFSEFTQRIGSVDPKSALYEKGVRPGDIITKYDGRDFHGFRDLLVASIMGDKTNRIEGYKVDYETKAKKFYNYTLKTYEDPRSVKDQFATIGVLSPAQYLIYQGDLPPNSALGKSGIQENDRILWADGELLFSIGQLSSLINESTSFLTVKRGEDIFHTKVPRTQLDDLKMTLVEKGEIDDWQHEARVKGKLNDLYFIPYNLSPTLAVESRIDFIDEEEQKKAFQQCQRCGYFTPLQEGDQILAVEGTPLKNSYELLEQIQTRRVLMIVQREGKTLSEISWKKADEEFGDFSTKNLDKIVSSIGTNKEVQSAGKLVLLNPVTPKPFLGLGLSQEQKAQYAKELSLAKKQIEEIKDPEKRSDALLAFEKNQDKLVLGVPLKDRTVNYNPGPIQQFSGIFQDTYRTLSGLLTGYLKPKYISGPIGIVHIVHLSWLIGMKEALFWMAVISLNLGLMNLLPIPVLDGGHIMFSLFEMVTKRPISSKVMEKMILPFFGLLIALFIYITYQDLHRLLSKFF